MRRIPFLRRFFREETGVLSTEAVLILPLLMWGYLGLFTMFDAFRLQNINVRAAYTISDMLSRETEDVTPDFLAGLNSIFALLIRSPYPTVLRVTVVRYDEANDDMILVWSHVAGGTGGKVPITEATMDEFDNRIPVMANAATGIVVETWGGFVPMLNIGIDAQYFENFVVTRPRFGPQLKCPDCG